MIMLATLPSCSKNCALDVLWKQVMVNSIPEHKFNFFFFRMEPTCNSVDLFFFYLVGQWLCFPSRYFPNFCALILFKQGWNTKQESFFLFKSVEITWAHGKYINGFGTLTELFIPSSTHKKPLPNLKIKPDTPIEY